MSERKHQSRGTVNGPYRNHRRWRIRLIIEGEVRYRSYPTRSEAEKALAIYRKALQGERSLGDAIDSFLAELRKLGRSHRTIANVTNQLHRYFPDRSMALRAWTPNKAQAYAERLLDAYAHETIRGSIKGARQFGRFCVRKKWLRSNPAESIQLALQCKRGKKQLRINEARAFYSTALDLALAGDEGAAASLCCLVLTLRRGEVVNISARDVDDDGRVLWISTSKTEAGKRALAVPNPLASILSERAAATTGRIFPHTDRWVYSQVRRVCDLAAVPRVSPHALRGTHATIAQVEGVAVEAVSKALGHAGTGVTRAHYTDAASVQSAANERGLRVLEGGKTGTSEAGSVFRSESASENVEIPKTSGGES